MHDTPSDGAPFPSASSIPQHVTETAEKTNPAEIIRSAFTPMSIVSALEVNSPIIFAGIVTDSITPRAITPAVSAMVVLNVSFTLFISPAP